MELRHLQTFATVMELQSYTRAAERLSVTQAAVSHHIAHLQRELHVALFERKGRRMLPTPAGQLLNRYVREILDRLTAAKDAVRGIETAVTGRLKIAACAVAAETILPHPLRRFRHAYPLVREELAICESAEAICAVEAGAADFAIVIDPPRSVRVTATPIASDDLLLIVPVQHRLAALTEVTLDQLGGETLIGREQGSRTRGCVIQALRQAGLSPDALTFAIEMNSDMAIRSAVEQGVGIAFLPRSIVQDALASGQLVATAVSELPMRLHYYLATDPRRTPCRPARAFLHLLQTPQLDAPLPGGQ